MIYKSVFSGNIVISLSNSVNRNENVLKFHSQNLGKTIYENKNIFDSDFLKIVRVLESEKIQYYTHDFSKIVKELNKVCRHLKIESYEYLEI